MVGIVARAGADPDPLRKMASGSTDVREDPRIRNEMLAFLREHDVQGVVTTNTIMGCPHEEGADYPNGTKCPVGPFWRNRNRFTHEIEE